METLSEATLGARRILRESVTGSSTPMELDLGMDLESLESSFPLPFYNQLSPTLQRKVTHTHSKSCSVVLPWEIKVVLGKKKNNDRD